MGKQILSAREKGRNNTKIKLSEAINVALDNNADKQILERLFSNLRAWELEKVANTKNISVSAQELLSKPGLYQGIHFTLLHNRTITQITKDRLKKLVSDPVKIYAEDMKVKRN